VNGRNAILAVAVIFLVGFLAITIEAAVRRGFTILSVVSIGVLLVMGIGIVGALLESRHDDEDRHM
jgi:hypothetical protein